MSQLQEVHHRVQEQASHRQVYLAGDSAGGGLALAVAYPLQARQKHALAGILLISPWVDVTVHNPAIVPLESRE